MSIDLHWHPLPAGRLAWVAVGPTSAPWVVAVPGLSDGLAPLWAPGMARVHAELGRRALPVRAHLVSHRDPVAPDVTTRDLADDLAAFLVDVLDRPAVVSGHSMGGMVAQHLAASHPDLVDQLVLTATSMRADAGMRTVLERWSDHVARADWRAFVADANACSYTGGELRRRRLFTRLTRQRFEADFAQRHEVLTRACLQHDSRDVAPRIQAPTVVVAGARDPVVAPSASRELAAAIPGARYVELAGLAHGFPEQVPDRMEALLRDRLDLDGQVRS